MSVCLSTGTSVGSFLPDSLRFQFNVFVDLCCGRGQGDRVLLEGDQAAWARSRDRVAAVLRETDGRGADALSDQLRDLDGVDRSVTLTLTLILRHPYHCICLSVLSEVQREGPAAGADPRAAGGGAGHGAAARTGRVPASAAVQALGAGVLSLCLSVRLSVLSDLMLSCPSGQGDRDSGEEELNVLFLSAVIGDCDRLG